VSRLVFGQSLSPDEIARVHRRTCGQLECARFDLRRGARADDCTACRFRSECGIRMDDKAAAKEALARGSKALEEECANGRRCPDFHWCDHVPVYLMTAAERREWAGWYDGAEEP
jgi:hypothetical protein